MSYFDHVRCSACKAMLDPENLITVQGQGMSCPRCRAPLSLKDLFGLRAAFAEEESPDLSLDALVSGFDDGPSHGGGAQPPPEPPRPRRSGARPSTSTGLVHRPRPTDDDVAEGEAPSALELMRSMKKRR